MKQHMRSILYCSIVFVCGIYSAISHVVGFTIFIAQICVWIKQMKKLEVFIKLNSD